MVQTADINMGSMACKKEYEMGGVETGDADSRHQYGINGVCTRVRVGVVETGGADSRHQYGINGV